MNEYISKEFMLKNLEDDKMNNAEHCEPVTIQIMERFIRYVKEFPAADVQPVKHGRWITWDDSGFTKCSCCNSEYYIVDLQTVGDSEGFVNFCPNCGARMEREKNE